VPRPAIEAGGGRRDSCTFLNKLFCRLLCDYARVDSVVFVHNFCTSPKPFGQDRRHCQVISVNAQLRMVAKPMNAHSYMTSVL
jgi:hypothetical protein